MPFATNFDDIYKLGIKDTAKEVGVVAERVDEQIYSEGILERIYSQIRAADIVIADMTGQNANVFYEVGFAHGLDKLCILLTQNSGDIPFDLKHQRHIVYAGSIAKLQSQLRTSLEWAKTEVANRRKSGIQLKHEITASLLKRTIGNSEKPIFADVTASFRIDLFNETNSHSPEIEAIYFYAGKKWAVRQNGNECSSTASDIPAFTNRYFLAPPMRKLPKRSWAQLNFTAERCWATAFRNEETILDSYDIGGRSVIRLVTTEGSFDYEILIEAKATDDVPF
ncbi:MAG: hypothetical protein V4773_09065 [Verrucomicrobiota bacterium]